jgi:hypothetical protein
VIVVKADKICITNLNYMKTKNLLAIAAVFITGMVSAQHASITPVSNGQAMVATPEVASFKWEKNKHEFGKIPQGKPVTVSFSFTNSGNKPLVVTKVNTPCGCTAADFSRESIAPGQKGFVKLTYNASANGSFSKTVEVIANTSPETASLTISGEVLTGTDTQH